MVKFHSLFKEAFPEVHNINKPKRVRPETEELKQKNNNQKELIQYTDVKNKDIKKLYKKLKENIETHKQGKQISDN